MPLDGVELSIEGKVVPVISSTSGNLNSWSLHATVTYDTGVVNLTAVCRYYTGV